MFVCIIVKRCAAHARVNLKTTFYFRIPTASMNRYVYLKYVSDKYILSEISTVSKLKRKPKDSGRNSRSEWGGTVTKILNGRTQSCLKEKNEYEAPEKLKLKEIKRMKMERGEERRGKSEYE